ncbi:hypothetical protein MRB53_035885 [Persea americana]|uniref:Uncharacterized protein n=1 Tax=Persea americana TaxID=3435 RepID=A0ACC2K6H1_PERAE|nr:hypothetical protein MRB53_035885 [Persea americana]
MLSLLVRMLYQAVFRSSNSERRLLQMRLMTLTGTPIRSKRARPPERTAKKVATLKVVEEGSQESNLLKSGCCIKLRNPEAMQRGHCRLGEIIAIEENPRVLTISEGGSQEFDFSITDMVGEASKEDFIRNLRPRLLEHVSLVLTAAGWDVVIWERGHRPSYLFVSSLKLGDHVVIACLLVEYVLYKKKTCRSGRISMIFGMAC